MLFARSQPVHPAASVAPAAVPARSPLPALFVSHGSPMFALEPGATGPALRAWAQRLPARPRGIVLMSPHWMTRVVTVTTGARPATWHDFGGFPPALSALSYPAPGEPALAQQVLGALSAAGLGAQPDAGRPFDHGAWVPLMHLFPAADVPLVQVSLPQASAAEVHAIGRALAGLADEGVLLVGSGSMTHNLREFFSGAATDVGYVSAFARFVEDAVRRADTDALLHWADHAPQALRAHPTDEHFLPLFFTLGAACWGERPLQTEWLSREVVDSLLAMDAFALQRADTAV